MHYFLIVGLAAAFGFCLALSIASLRDGSKIVGSIQMALAGVELGLLLCNLMGVQP